LSLRHKVLCIAYQVNRYLSRLISRLRRLKEWKANRLLKKEEGV